MDTFTLNDYKKLLYSVKEIDSAVKQGKQYIDISTKWSLQSNKDGEIATKDYEIYVNEYLKIYECEECCIITTMYKTSDVNYSLSNNFNIRVIFKLVKKVKPVQIKIKYKEDEEIVMVDEEEIKEETKE